MKKLQLAIVPVLLALFITSCEVVGGIFKAGMYWGIFLVVAFVALIIYLVAKMRRK